MITGKLFSMSPLGHTRQTDTVALLPWLDQTGLLTSQKINRSTHLKTINQIRGTKADRCTGKKTNNFMLEFSLIWSNTFILGGSNDQYGCSN